VSEPRQIREILDRVKIRFRLLTLVGVIAGLGALILGAIAVQVAVDQLLPLPRWLRVITFLGGLSGRSGSASASCGAR
jgi:hypothetical protein